MLFLMLINSKISVFFYLRYKETNFLLNYSTTHLTKLALQHQINASFVGVFNKNILIKIFFK